ncbi:uncharacterized protein LOC123558797 [Mercenaria mercenaria]|uniref:uncharacterized protein LOC123558797 n=1 Tax=Mercenaria mercenaria TaxID=6596 RepID=UPI00234F0156|nr:uncharacterized protein LOC123558797 [Mercenaria mercenaria]
MDLKRKFRLYELKRSVIEKAFEKTVNEVVVPMEVPMGKLILVTEDLYQKALEIPKTCFIEDEPLVKSIGLHWSDDFESFWLNTFKANMSFILINKDNGEVIGLKATEFIKKEEKDNLKDFTDAKLREIVELLGLGDRDYFDKYKTEEAFHFLGIGVAKEYRRCGIGTFLVRVALKFLENLGISTYYIKCEASSNYSQRILEKCGFDTIKEVPYKDYKKYGKVVFDNTGEHKSMKIYGKCLVDDTL